MLKSSLFRKLTEAVADVYSLMVDVNLVRNFALLLRVRLLPKIGMMYYTLFVVIDRVADRESQLIIIIPKIVMIDEILILSLHAKHIQQVNKHFAKFQHIIKPPSKSTGLRGFKK